ncbi:MAG: hypothetical protein HeimC3_16130 [Candidatus Heimdallarchaeota archaeon LC_3]|nr:MAG: hypothetical protein HeimC3_16130 [Candidatus Heimdallarchaeota archaeon LC_3]
MIICPSCKKEFPISSESGIFSAPLIHESENIHKFKYKNRKIYLEKFIRIVNEEEISLEDSGELEAEENPFTVACYLCGTRGNKPCICPMCNIVVCVDCWDDHDEILIEVELDNNKEKYFIL